MINEQRLPGDLSIVVNGREQTLRRSPGEGPEDFAKRLAVFLNAPTHARIVLPKEQFHLWFGNKMSVDLGNLEIAPEQSPATSPPRLGEFILLLIPLSQREHLRGDLEEEFKTIVVPKYGVRLARLYYRWQVLVEVTMAITNGLKGVLCGWLLSKFKM